MTRFRTETYRVPRYVLARLAAEEYVRTAWWIVLPVPVLGLAILMLFGDAMRPLGVLALFWPLTIPARAVISTSRAGKLFERGVWMSVEEDAMYFHGTEDGLKLNASSVRGIVLRHGYYHLRLRRLEFIPIPACAFAAEADRVDFETYVRDAIETRLRT